VDLSDFEDLSGMIIFMGNVVTGNVWNHGILRLSIIYDIYGIIQIIQYYGFIDY
jgi:hypothetical protein